MSELTFYTHPMSRGRVVRWMLEEIGIDYSVKAMEFDSEMKSEDYLAINPMGKVPAIKHGNTVVTEVAAICAYLADQVPDKKLSPPPFEMATSAKAYNWKIDSSNVQAVGCGQVEDSINTLEKVLSENAYICGDQFTAADILVSSYLWWETMQENIPPKEVFKHYIERMESRPAAKRANELDDELAKKMKPLSV